MKSSLLLAASSVPWVAALSLNSYDLGFQGLYPRLSFHSVDFEAPKPKITQWDDRCDYGNLFFTPRGPWVTGNARGPVITDPKGNLIWMDNKEFTQALNFNVQQYKGEDYLTFWTKQQKTKKNGHKKKKSKKSYVMLNSAYEVAYRITPVGKHLKGDSHEFRITPQGTALITIYHKHKADCTDLKLGKKCWIQDGLFQEIDIETGELLFEWRATDHIRMTDVYSYPNRKDGHGKSKEDAFDFFHINSVDKTEDGNYIISARYMHAVVCVSGQTGEIIWQLGGKNNNFEDLDHATDFAWQHHVTWQGNNTLTLFDNHANNVFHSPSSHSKGMIIQLNFEDMTASLVQKYPHPSRILNVSQGSVQIVPESGNVLVGFGNSPTYVEYNAEDGKVLCNAHFAAHLAYEIIDFGLVKSYRIFKHPWVGHPKTIPDVKVKHDKAYVSWNGATEVKEWRLETGPSLEATEEQFVTVQQEKRSGFETEFKLGKGKSKYVRVAAVAANSSVLAYSAVAKVPSPPSLLLSFALCIFALMIMIFGLAGVFVLYRRYPGLHVKRFPRLQDVKVQVGQFYTAFRGNTHKIFAGEEEQMLLNERDTDESEEDIDEPPHRLDRREHDA